MIDAPTVEDAVAEAVINRVLKVRRKGSAFEGFPQQSFQKERVEGVVDVRNEIVGGCLPHRFNKCAVAPHGLDVLHYTCHRRDDAIAELSLLKVDRLLEPCQLQQQSPTYGN